MFRMNTLDHLYFLQNRNVKVWQAELCGFAVRGHPFSVALLKTSRTAKGRHQPWQLHRGRSFFLCIGFLCHVNCDSRIPFQSTRVGYLAIAVGSTQTQAERRVLRDVQPGKESHCSLLVPVGHPRAGAASESSSHKHFHLGSTNRHSWSRSSSGAGSHPHQSKWSSYPSLLCSPDKRMPEGCLPSHLLLSEYIVGPFSSLTLRNPWMPPLKLITAARGNSSCLVGSN